MHPADAVALFIAAVVVALLGGIAADSMKQASCIGAGFDYTPGTYTCSTDTEETP